MRYFDVSFLIFLTFLSVQVSLVLQLTKSWATIGIYLNKLKTLGCQEMVHFTIQMRTEMVRVSSLSFRVSTIRRTLVTQLSSMRRMDLESVVER